MICDKNSLCFRDLIDRPKGLNNGGNTAQPGYYLSTYMDVFHKKERFEMEYSLRHNSGEYRYIYDIGVPYHSEDGTFEGYLGSCIDIRQLKQLQEQKDILIEKSRAYKITIEKAMSEQKHANNTLDTIIQLLPVGIMIADSKGKIITENKNMKNIRGG